MKREPPKPSDPDLYPEVLQNIHREKAERVEALTDVLEIGARNQTAGEAALADALLRIGISRDSPRFASYLKTYRLALNEFLSRRRSL